MLEEDFADAGAESPPWIRAAGSGREQMQQDGWKADVRNALVETRRRTLGLVERLPQAWLRRQVRSFLSPILWDLGHIANFEDRWLVRAVAASGGTSPDRDAVYDPFVNPRESRAELDLPDLEATVGYLDEVRARSLELLEAVDEDTVDPLLRQGFVYRMVVQHEGQHQETLLQALDIPEDDWGIPGWDGIAPLLEAPRRGPPGAATDGEEGATAPADPGTGVTEAGEVDDTERVFIPPGPFLMGTRDRARAYDNERQQHRLDLDGYLLDRHPVTARRWAEFVDAGGYRRRELWSGAGRAWLDESGCAAPQGWEVTDGEIRVVRLGRRLPLRLDEPVQHVNFWEAEAFARWAGGRLPTEAEWEKAAVWDPEAGRRRPFPWGVDPPTPSRTRIGGPVALRPRPRPVGSAPDGASAYGVDQLLGDVYEWTSSSFEAYPGFEPFPYREYSEVFFGDRYRVLRGGSWASHEAYARSSYRNWDLPCRRQLFAGVRLAWDPD